MDTGVPATAGLGRPRDPLALVLGEDERPRWFYAAAAVAFVMHSLMVGSAAAGDLLKELRLAVQDNRARVHDFFWRQYDIELPKEKPKPEEKAPDPPPEPEPAPPPPPAPKAAPAPKDDDPYKNLPPAPAKAAPVLTQKDDPDEPKDLTNTVVTGDGTATYGQVSAAGTGSAPVMAPHASNKGVPGGKGAAPAASAPGEDRSRPPGIAGGLNWRGCPFPAEAEAEDINQARVTLVVTVRPDGTAISATVTSDPGHGFGRAARICALARRYTPGLDRNGQPITMTTPPINVTFSR